MEALSRILDIAEKKLIPLTVHFDLTYRCHQSCIHCYLPEAWRRGKGPTQEFSISEIKNILDQLAALGTFFLTFSGGEIFLRPDIFTILEYARRRNFAISLLTTGTHGLGKAELKFLSELGIKALFISLYSMDPEIHDKITGVPGSWTKVRYTTERAKALGLRIVFNCVVLNLNYKGILALKKFANQENIPLRLDDEIRPRWDSQPLPSGLALNDTDKESLWSMMENESKRERITVHPAVESAGCGAGLNCCYISPTGEIWPCVDLPWRCGSVRGDNRIDHIWHESDVFKQVRHLQTQWASLNEKPCDLYCNSLKSKEINPQYLFPGG